MAITGHCVVARVCIYLESALQNATHHAMTSWRSVVSMIKNRIVLKAGAIAIAVGAVAGAGDRLLLQTARAQAQAFRFQLEEATIDDVHRAIRERQVTCRSVVQSYINRARAYNGV